MQKIGFTTQFLFYSFTCLRMISFKTLKFSKILYSNTSLECYCASGLVGSVLRTVRENCSYRNSRKLTSNKIAPLKQLYNVLPVLYLYGCCVETCFGSGIKKNSLQKQSEKRPPVCFEWVCWKQMEALMFWHLQAQVLMFNCFADFWLEGYQRGSLGKSHQNSHYLKTSSAKKLSSNRIRTCGLWITLITFSHCLFLSSRRSDGSSVGFRADTFRPEARQTIKDGGFP